MERVINVVPTYLARVGANTCQAQMQQSLSCGSTTYVLHYSYWCPITFFLLELRHMSKNLKPTNWNRPSGHPTHRHQDPLFCNICTSGRPEHRNTGRRCQRILLPNRFLRWSPPRWRGKVKSEAYSNIGQQKKREFCRYQAMKNLGWN